jgi:hypothetical protein
MALRPYRGGRESKKLAGRADHHEVHGVSDIDRVRDHTDDRIAVAK